MSGYDDRKVTKHESFAMLEICRTQSSGGQALFGSSILHNNTVRLRICEGSVDRHINTDWYHAGKEYIDIEMSQSQFAEAITSMNMGGGVPVTLRRLNGQRIEDCPFTNKRMEFENEFEQKMQKLNVQIKTLTEQTEKMFNDKNKKTFTKTDKDNILNELRMLRQEIASNTPYVMSCFNEQMDKTVQEAKGEVEGFVMHKVISAGLEGLQKELKLLGDNE